MTVQQRPDEIPSPQAINHISGVSKTSAPTVRKVYYQQFVQQSLYERIRDAAEQLGYSRVYPIPPRVRTNAKIGDK